MRSGLERCPPSDRFTKPLPVFSPGCIVARNRPHRLWLLPLIGLAGTGLRSAGPPRAPGPLPPEPVATSGGFQTGAVSAGRKEAGEGNASWTPVPDSLGGDIPISLDSILETNRGWEAWVNGRGYREGARLAPGLFISRIGAASIVVMGPGGPWEIFLKSDQADRSG